MGGKMIDELKPCPFCGGEAVLYANEGIRVLCQTCRASTWKRYDCMLGDGTMTNVTKDVIDAWNRRVDDGQR